MSATLTRRQSRAHLSAPLVESYALDLGTDRRIDEDAGVIYGVKLCGRFSENSHGFPGVTEGTEYTREALKGAVPLYEGAKVYLRHLQRNKPADGQRGPFDYIGVIRNARYDDKSDCPRGDLHYRKTHPDSAQLVEDVKRDMGGFGLSHHVPPGKFSHVVKSGRLVINRITAVKSVDLVDDPATTRTLFESRAMPTTLRALLESRLAKLSPARRAVAQALLEDDLPGMDAPVDAPMDAPADADAGGDPEDQLWQGFLAACTSILSGEGTAKEKGKKITEYLAAHEKLTGSSEPKAEPEAPAATEEDETPDDKEKKDDETVKESKEVRKLRAENACLKAGVEATPALVKALGLLESDAERTALLTGYKPAATIKPKSGVPAPKGGKSLTESKVPAGAAFLSSIRE
jgi:hypothetical protein